MNIAVNRFIGRLRRIDHQSEHQRRHDRKNIRNQPDDGVCLVVSVVSWKPRAKPHDTERRTDQNEKHPN
ncbi:hypothetical protein D3C87_2100440 [compost metagenome]